MKFLKTLALDIYAFILALFGTRVEDIHLPMHYIDTALAERDRAKKMQQSVDKMIGRM